MLAIFVVPTMEVFLFMLAGKTIGVMWTLAIILATGILGGYLAKSQGLKAWRDLQQNLQNGQMPGDSLMDGALILAGGILLITPGFFTDAMGLLLLLPVTRAKVRQWIISYFKQKMIRQTVVYTYRRP